MNSELAAILEEMGCESRDARTVAYEKFRKFGNDNVQFYIDLLDLGKEYSHVRNAAAYQLRCLHDQRAFQPLLSYALNPENIHYNGSMVYALEVFDCSMHFLDIFTILFYHGDEAKNAADDILWEQEFLFDDDDLLKIKAMWEECKLNPTLCPRFDYWAKTIQATVDNFLVYLE